MVREIKKTRFDTYVVNSMPGDATRYSFVLIKHGEYFLVAPYNSNLAYPGKVHKFARPGNDNLVETLSKRYNSNPYTVREVFRCIHKITHGEIK